MKDNWMEPEKKEDVRSGKRTDLKERTRRPESKSAQTIKND